MRELGVAKYRSTILGPDPAVHAAKIAAEKADPFFVKREHYSSLLGRPVSDLELKNLP